MSASRKPENLKFCHRTPPAPGISPTARRIPTRLATPGRQILSFSCCFASRIPTPCPGKPCHSGPISSTAVAGRNFRFPVFQNSGVGAREIEAPKKRRGNSGGAQAKPNVPFLSPSRNRPATVRVQLGFGLSSSGTNLLYVLGFENVAPRNNGQFRRSSFGIGSGGAPNRKTQK